MQKNLIFHHLPFDKLKTLSEDFVRKYNKNLKKSKANAENEREIQELQILENRPKNYTFGKIDIKTADLGR